MRGLKNLEGKKVFALINSQTGRRRYSGIVKEVTELGSGFVLVGMVDKFGKFVAFASNEIELIEEEFDSHNERRKEEHGDAE